MRIAILGRTEMLLDSARALVSAGHEIGLVATCRASGHELAQEDDFRTFAAAQGAPFLMGPRLDRPETLAILTQARCDVGISMNWLTLIPSVVRDAFTHGVFNAHPGDLPRFKGNACPNWAILLGETQLVLAIHRMIDRLDAGPIALRRQLRLHDQARIGEVYEWLRTEIPAAYVEFIGRLEQGDVPLEEQPSDPASSLRCYPRRPEDGRIDWSLSAAQLSRLVRASSRPFDGAFTTLEGARRLTVWNAAAVAAPEPFVATPGQIAYGDRGEPVVCCGEDYLRLTEIELEGCATDELAKAAVLSSLRNRLI